MVYGITGFIIDDLKYNPDNTLDKDPFSINFITDGVNNL